MMKRETYGWITMGIGIILIILWATAHVIESRVDLTETYIIGKGDVATKDEYGLKKGEIITLHLGTPTQIPTKHKNRNAIFTYTGKIRSYYTIDYQSCDGKSGTGTQSYCEPHKIFIQNLVEIDDFLFKIKSCVDDCRTLLTLEFIQYK